MNPTVSVCMVTYNHERYIAQSINSVLEQVTDFPVEIVIGEDVSTDSTRAIVRDIERRHPEKIRVLYRDENLGMFRNFQDAFSQCQGRYIALLDGDDYFASPHKLQSQFDFMEAHPECVVCGHRVWIERAGEELDRDENRREIYPSPQPEIIPIETLLSKPTLQTCSVFYRAGVIARIPDWIGDHAYGDWMIQLCHAEHGMIGFMNEPMSVYRIHAGGAWSKLQKVARLEADIEACKELSVHISANHRPTLRRRLTRLYQRSGWLAFESGERGSAIRYGLRAIREDPFSEAPWRLLACALIKPIPDRAGEHVHRSDPEQFH